LAQQLKIDKNTACRRAFERILAMIKKQYDEGAYEGRTVAELEFRKVIEPQSAGQKAKSPRTPSKNWTEGNLGR
jgi:hypothetical protein